MDDPQGLTHFFHPAQIAIIAVAILAHRNEKIELVIALIGLRAAQIPRHARPAHHHTAKAPIKRLLLADNANISIALLEDAVFGQKPVDIIQHAGEFIGPGLDIVNQRRR